MRSWQLVSCVISVAALLLSCHLTSGIAQNEPRPKAVSSAEQYLENGSTRETSRHAIESRRGRESNQEETQTMYQGAPLRRTLQGLKSRELGGPTHSIPTISGLDLAPEAEDILDGEILSTWFPHRRSHWQGPVNPFVSKRDVRLATMVEKPHSSLEALTNLLPGMKAEDIPKIFHQVYLDGEDALVRAEVAAESSETRWPPVKRAWREACKGFHPDWEFKLWNLSSMEAFLEDRYPWFLPTFHAYPANIHKVDAVRPFLMHAFGGVYIDLDTECMQPVDPFLEDHDLVFQMEDFGEKSLVNSAIAGRPGLYFWEVWQQVIVERAVQANLHRSFFAKRDWEVVAVLNTTGPWTLRAAFQRFGRDYGYLKMSYVGPWTINNTRVMVYPLGTWFVPCLWNNARCHRLVEDKILNNDIPPWMAGHHKNAGSWFKAVGFSRQLPWWDWSSTRLVIFGLMVYCFWRFWKRYKGAKTARRNVLPGSGSPDVKLA